MLCYHIYHLYIHQVDFLTRFDAHDCISERVTCRRIERHLRCSSCTGHTFLVCALDFWFVFKKKIFLS